MSLEATDCWAAKLVSKVLEQSVGSHTLYKGGSDTVSRSVRGLPERR